jgi:hypothetical protein
MNVRIVVFEGRGTMKSEIIRGIAALLLALALSPAAAQTAETPDGAVVAVPERVAVPAQTEAHPFAAIAGNWTGGGVIMLTNDIKENLRCRANHGFAQASSSLSLSIKCSSDNYRFELTSNVVERRGVISGKWSEASYKVSGNISGRVAGNRITAVAQGDSFTSPITLTTTGNRQTVSMTPEKTYVISVQIALNRQVTAPASTARR